MSRIKNVFVAVAFGAAAISVAGCSEDVAGVSGEGGVCSTTEDCNTGLACHLGKCLIDTDGDGHADVIDNCPSHYNPDQTDSNGNGIGDACDTGSSNNVNNTPDVGNNDVGNNNNNNNTPDVGTDVGDPDDAGGYDVDPIDPPDPHQTRREGRDFDTECSYINIAAEFEPSLKWELSITENDPYYRHPANDGQPITQVMMTPAVANLTDDNNDGNIDVNDVPDIIFTTFSTRGNAVSWDEMRHGVLRAASGDGSGLLWSVGYKELARFDGITDEAQMDSRLGIQPAGSIAVGDITGDGKVEIIAGLYHDQVRTGGLVAIRNDGTILWKSTATNAQNRLVPEQWSDYNWGGPAIGDLDGDGTPEIVIGALVFDNQGNLLWDGAALQSLVHTPGIGSNSPFANTYRNPLSLIANVNNNAATQEVITGRTVYTIRNGELDVLWEAAGHLPDGFPAIGDFTGNGMPDIVVAAAGTVRIHDGLTGAVVWGPVEVPGGGRLGPPTVADFNGDGTPEIGVAGSNQYVALKVDIRGGSPTFNANPTFLQAKLWTADTQDESSNVTGSSVFDFKGDGRAEVIYNDELRLRIFDGATGDVLFDEANTSFTAIEYPIIVDVNNDGAANIVVGTNDFECGVILEGCTPGFAGIRVFGDANDNWVATRRIWNQHSYNITNINENGTIPAQPTPSWTAHNTYRLNALTTVSPQAAPDLMAEEGSISDDGCEGSIRVWITNAGAVRVGAGIPVSFYAVQGAARQYLGSAQTQQALEPGESERVEIFTTLPSPGTFDIIAVADDIDGTGQGTRNECNEDNNTITVAPGFSC